MRNATLRRWRRREVLWDIGFLAPQYVLYVTLTLVPFVIAMPIMFTDQATLIDNSIDFVGLRNFVSVFQYPVGDLFLPALWRTVRFTVLNYVMTWLFGMSLALLMFEMSSRLQRGFFTVIYLPYIVSGLGIGMMATMLFAKDTGSLNLVLLDLGILRESIDVRDPAISTVMLPFVVGWRYAGFNMALFLSGLLTIPEDTISAARVDGASYFQRLVHVYFPQMVPSIMMATVLTLIGSFGVFDELVGMGAFIGNTSVQLLSIVLYKMGFGGANLGSSGTLAEAITVSMVVYVPLLFGAFGLVRLQRRLTRGLQ